MDNILLIAPEFYGYYKDIKEELEFNGHNVYFIKDQITQNLYNRLLKKINKKKYFKKQMKFLIKNINSFNDINFNKIIIILASEYNDEMIIYLKNKYQHSKFIYYTWDSVYKYPNIINLTKHFDYVYSFDDVDCKKYNFKFLPLYYKNKSDIHDYEYVYSTVTSYFPEKNNNIQKTLNLLDKNVNHLNYFYVKSKLFFYYLKLRYHKNYNVKIKDVFFKSLSKSEVINIFNNSFAVYDCLMSGQCGLSIRTFEVLALKTKFITTNPNIKKYDFYNENNIFVIDDDTKFIPKSFFETKFDSNYKLDEKYNITHFVKRLLGEEEFTYLKDLTR